VISRDIQLGKNEDVVNGSKKYFRLEKLHSSYGITIKSESSLDASSQKFLE